MFFPLSFPIYPCPPVLKQRSSSALPQPAFVLQELQKKTHALEAKASKSRELMLRVEKAQTEHTEKGQEHAKSIAA